LTPDQYYLLKALVLANSDDLTLASSSAATSLTGKQNEANKPLSKSNIKIQQQQSAVKQFRATITRALHTHLEMTANTAMTSCCCCNGVDCCCPTAAMSMACCDNSRVTGVDGSGMAANCCCCSNNTVTGQLDKDGNVIVVVDGNQRHQQPCQQQQLMDTSNSTGGGSSAIISTTAAPTATVVGLVYLFNVYVFILALFFSA
jgi:hypothetical protein